MRATTEGRIGGLGRRRRRPRKGRVATFNATRPDGLDGGWAMDGAGLRTDASHILWMIDEEAAPDGTIALERVVDEAQRRYRTHPLFPKGLCATTVRSRRSTSKHGASDRHRIDGRASSLPRRILVYSGEVLTPVVLGGSQKALPLRKKRSSGEQV